MKKNQVAKGVRSGVGLAFLAMGMMGICSGVEQPVLAQAAYGSYVGIGGGFGVMNDQGGNGQDWSGVVAFRYKFLEVPVSLRAQGFVGRSVAVVPTVSYDIPLNWQTDLYIGAGAAFGSGSNGVPSPVGDKTSFALQPGIDYAVPNSKLVIFGNAVIAFDAYRNGGGTAVSVQGGVGYRF
ncbi:hypothetical protein K4A83_18455 [Spirulina subsalsa FACHB-351]|uniref:Outer membrane protein beta-barrel domain-containing protein n=1 Tax=Spirulina subsalsa FACHB-351 TaxID=234711 RepID=A0ABT3L9S5_9CYAN|nr:hypothetical protein [Spirulina subsalsa]MCW6038239.1 hypothetical protein [Spirulina subsalsa FACHB-351]